MSWNHGYVTDIEYTAGFFHEQSPAHLDFACLLNGYEPVALDRPFTYCELGCGRGFTSNILAAANPHGRFFAFDFNPAHVAEARALAHEAGLDNLVVREDSFADLASGDADLPQFDFVTMYGVYGWVNAQARRQLAAFLERHVKPGGIVYVNYNAMPGWSGTHPLQRLILEIVDAGNGNRTQRCEQARRLIGQLQAMQAGYFAGGTDVADAFLSAQLDSIRTSDATYLAHEFMNEGWQPLYHTDVRRDLAAAGLDYMGQAALFKLFPQLVLTAGQIEQLARTPAALRETATDFLTNNSFREDVYVRDARSLTPERRAGWMERFGLALARPRELVAHKTRLVTGEVIDRDALYVPLLDALAQAPRPLAELLSLPALQEQPDPVQALFEMVALLISNHQARGYCVRDQVASGPAQRMNRAIAFSTHYNPTYHALASPLLGSGVITSTPARLAYRALQERGDETAGVGVERITDRVWQLMTKEGSRAATDMNREALDARMHIVLELLLPLWRQLGIR